MKRSRVIVGAAVFLVAATPLFLLSCVTYGVRYGILTQIYKNADVDLPSLASILWFFGPLDWWSYFTPVAFAVGVAARIHKPMSLPILSSILAFSVIQSVVIYGAFQPFAKLGSVMGYPLPAPYPVAPLIANVVMLIGAVLFAVMSIRRSFQGELCEQEIPKAKEKAHPTAGNFLL
jgi:hypothetical protein